MTYQPGDIVIADIPDPDGNPIEHKHPAMIIRADSQNAYFLGISTKFEKPCPRHWIELPHDPNGHPVTGLKRPSVLKCNWDTQMLPTSRIVKKIGIVPTDEFELATDWIVTFKKQKLTNQGGKAS